MSEALDPHPSVVRFVKEFDPTLVVVPTPRWHELNRPEDERYMVAKPIRVLQPMNGRFWAVAEYVYPQLYVPQVMEVDEEWIRVLSRNRIKDTMMDLPLQARLADQAQTHAVEALMEEQYDELYYHFKKDFADFRAPNIKAVNPYDETKAHQDRLGRELK